MESVEEKDLIKVRSGRDASFFDLYSIDQLSQPDLDLIFDLARKFRQYQTYKFSFNKGCSMVNAFFEASTRTLISFDLSGKNLSMDTSSVTATSSVSKGESFLDTAETLDAYNLKVIVVRAKESGVPEMLARHVRAGIISAGDGWHEHPTQGLLDALTILDHFKSKDLKGRTITVVGDIMPQPRVRLAGPDRAEAEGFERSASPRPKTFLPSHVTNFGVKTFLNVEEALKGTDVVYALREQEERGAAGYIPSLREYSKMSGISRKRLDLAAKDAILMHPGPVRRDVDVHSALVAVDEQSHILRQVENGMAIRKALLWLLCDRHDGRVKEAKTENDIAPD